MAGGDTMGPPPPRGPANPRQMYGVQKGFSMLDWGLLNRKAADLSGSGKSGMRVISMAEVRQHKSEHDCWTVFRGKVYNMAPFLAYHPGGKPELMKGAGRDCTTLFNKYHPWVNGESLLANLVLGFLEEEGEKASGDAAPAAAAAAAAAAPTAAGERIAGSAGGAAGGAASGALTTRATARADATAISSAAVRLAAASLDESGRGSLTDGAEEKGEGEERSKEGKEEATATTSGGDRGSDSGDGGSGGGASSATISAGGMGASA